MFHAFGRAADGVGCAFCAFGRASDDVGRAFYAFGRASDDVGCVFHAFGRASGDVGCVFHALGKASDHVGFGFHALGKASDHAATFLARKALLETIRALQSECQAFKAQRRTTSRKIASRAGAAFVGLLRKHLANETEARALIREWFVSSVDSLPDDAAGTLEIHIRRGYGAFG